MRAAVFFGLLLIASGIRGEALESSPAHLLAYILIIFFAMDVVDFFRKK